MAEYGGYYYIQYSYCTIVHSSTTDTNNNDNNTKNNCTNNSNNNPNINNNINLESLSLNLIYYCSQFT